jgi:type I restriction enzyme S subunit
MSKKVKQVIPKLRFPEFVSTAEWKITTLNSLATKIAIKNKDCSITRILTNSAVGGVVNQSDYFEREIVTQSNIDNYFIIDKGDYVYNPRISASAPVGPISKNKIGKGVMSPLYTIFRFYNTQNEFYEHYFKTNLWNSYLKTVSNTGARHDRISISVGKFMRMPLPYSTDENEQKKIAYCLSYLDDLISAENEKLLAFKNNKKGLMQKLFPADGEFEPELRFPEFRGCGEWKITTLNSIAAKIAIKNKDSTITRILTNSAVGGVVNQSDYFEREIVTQSNIDNYFIVDEGDYVYNPRISTSAPVGPISKNKIGKGVMSPLYTIFRFHNTKNKFYEQYFKTNLWNSYLKNISNTGARHDRISISVENFMKMPLPYSTNEKEQQKIADVLSALDNLITAQSEKIEALKQHKKALIQGLFPSIQEVAE